jgi:lipopolysaccharide/colanic/teichoic acid biosynthesis glycosyltransferase
MDIIVSTLALIAFLPLFLIIPILIKLTSRGPVFYKQMRAGHNGQPFKIYKFRSMVADAEKILQNMMDFDTLKEPVFKFHNDPRVTFIGNILRKTSIDELPQLFNVLKGDLSLVGPRPEEIALVKRYEPFFRERLKLKPGITGIQQITCRGSTSLTERMKYDLLYIKNRSLWLDIKILFKTFAVVALQKRAT